MVRLNEIREWVIQTQLQYDQTLEIMEYTDESKNEIHVKITSPWLKGFHENGKEVREGNVKTDFVLKLMNDYKNNPNSMTAKQREDAWKLKIIESQIKHLRGLQNVQNTTKLR